MSKCVRACVTLALILAPQAMAHGGQHGRGRHFFFGLAPLFALSLHAGAPETVLQPAYVANPRLPPPPVMAVGPSAAPLVAYVPVPVPVPAQALPAPAPPPVVTAPPPPAPRLKTSFAHVAVKYSPGLSVDLGGQNPVSVGPLHSLGVELRLAEWLALRSDLVLRPSGASWDALGLKVSVPSRVLAPYASVSLSGSGTATQPGRLQVGLVGALGLDLKLGRHFFFQAEVHYRVLPDACCREVPQVAGTIGAGIAFL
jgi:hypothetical protein